VGRIPAGAHGQSQRHNGPELEVYARRMRKDSTQAEAIGRKNERILMDDLARVYQRCLAHQRVLAEQSNPFIGDLDKSALDRVQPADQARTAGVGLSPRATRVSRTTLSRWEIEGRGRPVYGKRVTPGAGFSLYRREDIERLKLAESDRPVPDARAA
jgi:hypothetical protein